MMKQLYINIAILLLLSFGINHHISASNNKHHHHEAHVHGVAELFMTMEDQWLQIDLQSPAANIVGFEHQATTSEQRQIAMKAQKQLESAEKLLRFDGMDCQAKEVTTNFDAIFGTSAEHHHDHADHHSMETHSNITVSYRFQCKVKTALKTVAVDTLLMQFPAIEQLAVQWITDHGQGGVHLTAKKSTFEFK